MGKQSEFVGEAATVATKATVGGDDAVTGDENAERVPADGVTNGARGSFVGAGGDGAGEGAVGGGLAPRDLAELVGDGLAEGGDAGKAVRWEWSGEVTGEIVV